MESDAGNNQATIAERRGFYYPAFSIYSGTSGFYNYGGAGLRIKRNIEHIWRTLFVEALGATELETTTIMPEPVFRASGHLATFTDPVIKCEKCGTAFRADKLLEQFYEKKKDTESLAKIKKMSREEMERRIKENGIRCEKCGNKDFSKIEPFNLMFKTHIGPKTEEVAYLRPETAQGIFVDFKRAFRLFNMKLPAIISQVGIAYRNEISPRQQLVRLREFRQMDTEIFFDPEMPDEDINDIGLGKILKAKISFIAAGHEHETSKSLEDLLESKILPSKYLAMLLYLEDKLLKELGINPALYRFRELEKEELPHYSKGNVDVEVKTSYGYIEVAGNAYRTDFDLSQHAKVSGEDITVVSNGKKIIPHVIEATLGFDRLFFSTVDTALVDDKERGWQWLRLNKAVAPYLCTVFPLQKDEGLEKKAKELYGQLSANGTAVYYSETGSIGKRYARADEIGIPFSITVDYDTLKDEAVTIRDRDTTHQSRIRTKDVKKELEKRLEKEQ